MVGGRELEAGSLVAELKRRRVFRALVGYGIAAFAVLQIIEPVMHGLHWPDEVLSYVVVALAVGFPVVVSLAWIFDVKAGRIERTGPASSTAGLRGPGLALLLVGIGLLAATPGVLWYFLLRSRPAIPSSEQALRAKLDVAPPASDIRAAPSIAALPLVNLSRDPDQEYFTDGLTEELLNLLAKVPGLHVTGRTSSFAFKGKNEDLRTIGQKLGVATVLEGSVQKAGDRVRITVQLINAADGYHLWSESYNRKLTDVFAVQDEIAQAVVEALRIKLLPGQTPTSKGRIADPDVYNQYLLGRQFFNLGNMDGWRRAVVAYEKSLALDPGYAPAWAGLSSATYWVADSADTPKAFTDGMRQARLAADKAVELAPALADGYVVRAFFRASYSWDWDGARADIQRALALSPEDPDVLIGYGGLLLSLGRAMEGVAVQRKVVQRDPLNARAWRALGSALLFSGQFAEAREPLNRSLEISPVQSITPLLLGTTYLSEKNPTAALAVFERSSSDMFRRFGLALAAHDLGRSDESQRALDSLIDRDADSAAFQIALVYAWRGEKDQAFQWLERAYRQHDGGLSVLKLAPILRSLRGDPRYTALLKKMNLPLD